MPAQIGRSCCEETFAPILYVLDYATLDEAIALQNGVPQGLSSAIFTDDCATAERSSRPTAPTAASPTSTSAPPAPRSAAPSAARRRPAADASGSDAWKAYMRRQTNTSTGRVAAAGAGHHVSATDGRPGVPVEPHRPLLVAAAGLLGLALQRTNGFYTPEALAVVVTALSWPGPACWRRRGSHEWCPTGMASSPHSWPRSCWRNW